MNNSPIAAWANRKPGRWHLLGGTGVLTLMLTYWAMGASDEMAEMQAVDEDRIEAQHQAQLERIQQKALQAACGGPEATVEQYDGGYYCRDRHGRKDKTIPGLARPALKPVNHSQPAFSVRVSSDVSECANSTPAGLVPAGFLKGSART